MTENPVVTEDQTGVIVVDHPDDEENELADDAEVDALIEGIDPTAPTLTGEEDV